MKNFNTSMFVLAIGLAFGGTAMAQGMSKSDYQVGKDKIAAEYKAGKASCDSLSGNAKDVCVEQAKGKEKIEKAEHEANYKPTAKTRYQARVARAEADYEVAKERCDDQSGNAKDVCIKEAKSAEVAAKADAKMQMETTSANNTAQQKTADARSDASDKKQEARQDATADKQEAQYKLEREKCDTYAGTAKTSCMDSVKARFGKL
jgi:hypothetical protein